MWGLANQFLTRKRINESFFQPRKTFKVSKRVVLIGCNFIAIALFSLISIAILTTNTRQISSNETDKPYSLFHEYDSSVFQANTFKLPLKSSHREVVMITAATHHYADMLKNLRCSILQSSRREIILFALDSEMVSIAKKHGISVIPWYLSHRLTSWDSGEKMSGPGLWGTQLFNRISSQKLEIVKYVLHRGLDVIFTDLDTVWCKDIPAIFQSMLSKHPHTDIFIQSNTRSENETGQPNTGFYYARSNRAVLNFFNTLFIKIEKSRLNIPDDQTIFWREACKAGKQLPNGDGLMESKSKNGTVEKVCRWNNGDMKISYLPLEEFPNGSRDLEGRPPHKVPKGYYGKLCRSKRISLWHINFISGSLKERRLKEQNLWLTSQNGSCILL